MLVDMVGFIPRHIYNSYLLLLHQHHYKQTTMLQAIGHSHETSWSCSVKNLKMSLENCITVNRNQAIVPNFCIHNYHIIAHKEGSK
jgi:hypothetical protein